MPFVRQLPVGTSLPLPPLAVGVRTTSCLPVAVACAVQNSCSWIGLTKNFKVREEDEDEVPRFIPYFGDSTSAVNHFDVGLAASSPPL
jgi:hypothetical protein